MHIFKTIYLYRNNVFCTSNQYVNPINLIAEMPGWEKDKVNDYLKSANGCLQYIKIDENDKEFATSNTGISLATLINDAKQYIPEPWSDEMANDKELLRIGNLIESRYPSTGAGQSSGK